METISFAVGLIVGLLIAWSFFLLYAMTEKQAKKREDEMVERLEKHIEKRGIRFK